LAIEGKSLAIEHVSALLDYQKVIGLKKDILEVQNAIHYSHLLILIIIILLMTS